VSAVAPAAPPRVAVVDLGSNSLHLLIAALPPGQAPALLAVHRAQAELGRHINGRIDPAREALTRDALAEMVGLARAWGVDVVEVAATASLRDAEDGVEVAERLSAATGARVRVLSGAEEAQATFLGVFTRAGQPGERLLVIDMGGRSTELILGEDGGILADLSLPLGHLRESSLSPEDEVRAALSAADAARFAAAQVDRVVVTAGTALTLTHMAALARGEHGEERHGRAATFEELAAVAERLNTLPLEARRALPGYDLRRERSLSRGASTLVALWRALGVSRVVACEAGLREGLIAARRR
jgi:exopolyphosphatase/guanosine-5'-triphosphate,3'-diphosphate pyrophosphatase